MEGRRTRAVAREGRVKAGREGLRWVRFRASVVGRVNAGAGELVPHDHLPIAFVRHPCVYLPPFHIDFIRLNERASTSYSQRYHSVSSMSHSFPFIIDVLHGFTAEIDWDED